MGKYNDVDGSYQAGDLARGLMLRRRDDSGIRRGCTTVRASGFVVLVGLLTIANDSRSFCARYGC